MPDFSIENEYEGPVYGIDEVGRGPLAGPVVAACVYIPEKIHHHPFVSDIKDSKKLSKIKLKLLNTLIHKHCPVSIAACSPEEIDRHNILNASLIAMKTAFEGMKNLNPHCVLIDGNRAPKDMNVELRTIVKGDNISKSIAAASIVAKFHRDQIMEQLHAEFPDFGWNKNVGYPTAHHRQAILKFGITPYHRKSFGPVKSYIAQNQPNKIP